MSSEGFSRPRETKAIERRRSRIMVFSVAALLVLVVALLTAPLQVVVVPAILILVGLKKAVVRYQELGARQRDLPVTPVP